MTVNARIHHDSFVVASPSTNDTIRVHGSFFAEAFITVGITANRSLMVAFRAVAKQSEAMVHINDLPVMLHVDSRLEIIPSEVEASSYSISSTKFDDKGAGDAVVVAFTSSKHVAGETQLQVNNREWLATIDSRYYPLREQNGDKHRLDVHLQPLANQLGMVAPHGLLGQTFDFDSMAVDGAKDNYDGKEVTTVAMGEGAIEGMATDYKISSVNPFSPSFKYSRWNLRSASPRDISKLTGGKHAKVENADPHLEL
jgi:hypothetical protein